MDRNLIIEALELVVGTRTVDQKSELVGTLLEPTELNEVAGGAKDHRQSGGSHGQTGGQFTQTGGAFTQVPKMGDEIGGGT